MLSFLTKCQIQRDSNYRSFESKDCDLWSPYSGKMPNHMWWQQKGLPRYSPLEGWCPCLLLYFQHLPQLLLQNGFSINIYHMKEEVSQEFEKTALTHLFGTCLLKCILNNFEKKQRDRLTNGTYEGFMKGLVRNGLRETRLRNCCKSDN